MKSKILITILVLIALGGFAYWDTQNAYYNYYMFDYEPLLEVGEETTFDFESSSSSIIQIAPKVILEIIEGDSVVIDNDYTIRAIRPGLAKIAVHYSDSVYNDLSTEYFTIYVYDPSSQERLEQFEPAKVAIHCLKCDPLFDIRTANNIIYAYDNQYLLFDTKSLGYKSIDDFEVKIHKQGIALNFAYRDYEDSIVSSENPCATDSCMRAERDGTAPSEFTYYMWYDVELLIGPNGEIIKHDKESRGYKAY